MLWSMRSQTDSPRLEDLPDEELLRELHLEPALVPDPLEWCAKCRKLSAQYRTAPGNAFSSASFREQWRELMLPFTLSGR